ncbi:5'-3' exoribonuclease 1-like isoform X2 [Babylonia areolata]|uniref:5'-3' exoribonuclease 1-like isoform X2 n=1 Tax=Babylonia areolata TaxID=304850 RepID=UPI003FCF848A
MGVPKFYRWISERYPCLSEVVKEFQLPEFDNLYLDMNGVVHVCSHPEDDNPHFRITEEQIFKDICHYIEFLFRMIKPRKVFFMAIDGVAPRAKMNQQRGRRFRSAREAEELIRQALERGEELPTEKRFDSNCITPGTPFMKRLQDHLKYFVVNKVTHDPLWQGPKIILSGHETPGEGEHKVMDFIRYSRSQPGHDPNTRHCLYGLDADLIMLGLTSHEPHFALLREEVRFGGSKKNNNKRPATPEETTFHLLHLSLMREYLDYEFSFLKGKVPFEYDLEKIIDDWILMGFLVGNDFIPHLPHLHIHHDALPLLWKTYMEVLPSLDGYLNEGGHLNLQRFEKYIGALAQFDRDQFSDQYMDMKYLEAKRTDRGAQGAGGCRNKPPKQDKRNLGDNAFAALAGLGDMDVEHDDDNQQNGQLEAHLVSQGLDTGDLDSDEDFDTFDAEFSAHKRNYYMTKLEYDNVTPEVLREQAFEYVRAIQWILLYYYEGVQSWSWYYPHHYAPFISDVRDFSSMEIRFDMSEPFRPFEQLMAVLPAASKELLPEPMQELMTSDTSPVLDYYPLKFQTDLNGKQQDWEAVVLIPFIDERRLLAAIHSKEHLLSPEERRRNSHGPCYMYQHSPELQGFYPSPMPGAFPDVAVNHAKVCEIPKFHFCLEPERIRKGLLRDTLLDVYFPGFPTLKHIPHGHRLDKCGVKVFQMNSRGFNMMLSIRDLPERRLEDLASELLGQTTWVGWPHLHEAKVYAVADERFKIEIEEHHKKGQSTPVVQWKRKELQKLELDRVYKEASTIKEKYHDRFGVEVGKTTVLIYAGPMTGRKYVYTSSGRITAEKQFSTNPIPYALQATCKDILTHSADDMHLQTMEELFPLNAAVFMLGHPHYGCQGEVLEVDNVEGRVRVSFNVLQEPDFSHVYLGQQMEDQQYMPGYVAAQRLGLNNHMLSRITGTVLILRGDGGNTESRANIGLNLKFTKRGEEVPGYTKKTEDGWLYSEKCVQVIGDYIHEFAELWMYISTSQTGNSDIYTEVELFPEDSAKKLKDVLKYLDELPCSKVKSMKSGADIVGDATILAIEQAVDSIAEVNKKKQKKVKMQVKPHVLFRPLPNQGTLEPDPGTTFEMFDRVVVVKMGYSVPFGLRGTIVGIHPGETALDTIYDVIFDQDFVGGIILRSSSKRGYRVPAVAMLNLTHGNTRKAGGRQQKQQQASAGPAWNAWNQQQPRPGFGFQGNWQQGQGQGHSSYSMLVRQEGARSGPGGYGVMPPPRPDQRAGHTFSQAPPRPMFVTPKFSTSPSKPAWGAPPTTQPGVSSADSGDFTSIWNQLLQSNTMAGGAPLTKPSHPSTSGGGVTQKRNQPHRSGGSAMANRNHHNSTGSQKEPSGVDSPIFGGASLQSAAEKLGKIALPTCDLMDVGSTNNPPTGILVDLSEPSQAGEDAVPPRSRSPATERTSQERNWPSHEQETKKTKTRIFTNSSHGQVRRKEDSSSVVALFEKATRAREEQQKSPSQPAQSDKVKALFDQVQKPTSMGSDPTSASSDFSSFFAALQVAPKSASPSYQGTSPQPSTEDGSAALKQMLKIGVEDSGSASEQSSKKSYGRHVSVQELFDVAKQVPSSAQSEKLTEPPSRSVPSQFSSAQQGDKGILEQQQQQQQQQLPPPQLQQQQPVVPPVRPIQPVPNPLLRAPSLLGAPNPQNRSMGRKPVDELAAFCQVVGKPMPKYDFNIQGGKQKGYICQVTLPGGARFEGSLSSSQQDAAESAASMALLCLKQAQMGFPGQRGGPWMQRPGPAMGPLRPGQPLFSSNSAFSPVTNPLMRFGPPMFSQPPPALLLPPGQQRGRQPLLSQPPPPFSNRGPHPLPTSQPPPPMAFSQALPRPVLQNQPTQHPPANHTAPLIDGHLVASQTAANKETPGVGGEEKVKEGYPQTKAERGDSRKTASTYHRGRPSPADAHLHPHPRQ